MILRIANFKKEQLQIHVSPMPSRFASFWEERSSRKIVYLNPLLLLFINDIVYRAKKARCDNNGLYYFILLVLYQSFIGKRIISVSRDNHMIQ